MRVVVTGGNRGIGLEVCRQLAAKGADVVLTARSAEQGERAAKEASGKKGSVTFEELDVSREESVRDFAARAKGRGAIDALVNNAGISMRGFGPDVAEGTLTTNLFGPLWLTDALSPLLAPHACVVHVSSGMGQLSSSYSPAMRREIMDPSIDRAKVVALAERFVDDVARDRVRAGGWPQSAYSVSKALLNALARAHAKALPQHRVNAVSPGWVRTDMGGASAPRSVEKGASGIVWAATLPKDGPTGGFFEDARELEW